MRRVECILHRTDLDEARLALLGRRRPSQTSGGAMLGKVRIRFWIESALAAITAALFAVTLMSPEWIELLFG